MINFLGRKIWALFSRDLAVARSYRIVFVLQLFEVLFGMASFYYLARFIESPTLRGTLPQGGSYFAFLLVGVAFFDYVGVALNAFDQSLLDARQNGTLEYLLVSQTSLPVILMGSVIYPFALLSLRTLVYLGWGILVFGFPHRAGQLGRSRPGSRGIGAGLYRVGRAVSKLHAGLQTRQSGEVVLPRSGRFGKRGHVSDQRVAGAAAWAARLIPVTYTCAAAVCAGVIAKLARVLCVGAAPNQGDGNTDPLLKKHAYHF